MVAVKSVKYFCPISKCEYSCILNLDENIIKDKKEIGLPDYICPCDEIHKSSEHQNVQLRLMLQC